MVLKETYVKSGRGKPKEKKEKKEIKISYTYDEAVDKVVELANTRAGVFPLEEDYEKAEESGMIDIEGLAEALNVKKSMWSNHVSAYAAINIATLRALRKREGREVHIVSEITRFS